MSIHPHPVAVIHRVFAGFVFGFVFSISYIFLWSFPKIMIYFFVHDLMAVLSSVFLNLLKLFCLLLGA